MLGTQRVRGTWQDQTTALECDGVIFRALRNVDVERVGHGPKEHMEPGAVLGWELRLWASLCLVYGRWATLGVHSEGGFHVFNVPFPKRRGGFLGK